MDTLLAHREQMTAYLVDKLRVPSPEAERSVELFREHWESQVRKDHRLISRATARKAVDAALEFLARAEGAPGKLADWGWHAALMWSREYEALCHALTGRMLYHVPLDRSKCGLPCNCHAQGKCKAG